MKTILCVEDDLTILANNQVNLADGGFRVLTAENLAQVRELLSQESPDAIVLDIMLPDGNGLDLLQELREAGSKVPVIMLTAWGEPKDVSRGLRLGANDYLSKPFDYGVLLARVEAMFRNAGQVPEIVEKGALRLDVLAAQAFLNGADMLLTQKEFSLLLLFTQNEGRTISAEYLYEKVWKLPVNDDKRTLQKHISALRKRLADGNYTHVINAVYGVGYCFEKAQEKNIRGEC
jgi:DNA-binding response OmpR family regulator